LLLFPASPHQDCKPIRVVDQIAQPVVVMRFMCLPTASLHLIRGREVGLVRYTHRGRHSDDDEVSLFQHCGIGVALEVDLHYVLDIAEVAAGFAVAVDINLFACQQCGGPFENDSGVSEALFSNLRVKISDVVVAIPVHKPGHPFQHCCVGLEAHPRVQFVGIGRCGRHISWLHGQVIFLRGFA
jgi:hypothetical protein